MESGGTFGGHVAMHCTCPGLLKYTTAVLAHGAVEFRKQRADFA